MVQLTVAAADAYSAAAINSSLIQSVLGSNAMATCLEVSLLECAVQCFVLRCIGKAVPDCV